ncbi:MAG: hypothetical protein JNK82_33105 [Myxococcaceae bacterium]|nr:hypothetical protein [Myxococcaceae bacterium]
MKTVKRKKLLLPAALVAGAACTPQPPEVCGAEPFHACWPDGGFACPRECGGLKHPDGGLDLNDDGTPVCFC